MVRKAADDNQSDFPWFDTNDISWFNNDYNSIIKTCTYILPHDLYNIYKITNSNYYYSGAHGNFQSTMHLGIFNCKVLFCMYTSTCEIIIAPKCV